MKKNVFSGVPVCHDFKGVLKGKMRTGIWVTWTKIVGGGGGGGERGGGGIVRLQKDLSLLTTKRSCSYQVSLMTERLGIEWKGLIRFRFCRRSVKSTCCYTRKTERLQFWRLLF